MTAVSQNSWERAQSSISPAPHTRRLHSGSRKNVSQLSRCAMLINIASTSGPAATLACIAGKEGAS